ncbi:MAG: hypothetical protein R3B91_03260 [Planctomycetaceae bacterium]
MKPPASLDWDLWLGPAPYRPFHEVYFPGPKWYRWWDFGNGTMSDLGSHWVDLPFWALELDAPLSIEASGPEPHPEIAPRRCQLGTVRTAWRSAGMHAHVVSGVAQAGHLEGRRHSTVGQRRAVRRRERHAVSDYGKFVLLPEEDFKDHAPPALPARLARSTRRMDHRLQDRYAPSSPFSYAGPLTEANHLGNVAFRAGGKIDWDSEALRVTNNEAANQFIARKPRDGWSLS